MTVSALGLDPARYAAHPYHSGDRAWLETNCYVDVWIELVHALGLDPAASLPFTVGLDFEGDQWLFYKQPTADLYELYGVDVQELQIYRAFLDHACAQVERGRIVLVEVDAFYLPDTRGVSYHAEHTKTTIGIETLDVAGQRLGYFHGAGYHELTGDDFVGVFWLRRPPSDDDLPAYTEFVKLERLRRIPTPDLVERSLDLLRRHLHRVPPENPFGRFGATLGRDLDALRGKPEQAYHQYAFATLRQCGSCYELASSYVAWLLANGQSGLEPARDAFEAISSAAKGIQLRAARAVLQNRPYSADAALETMASSWSRGVGELRARYGD